MTAGREAASRAPSAAARAATRAGAAHTYRRVLLLSPDFIVDERGRPWLEEVNTNGFMQDFLARQMTDAFRILLGGTDFIDLITSDREYLSVGINKVRKILEKQKQCPSRQ